MSESPEKIMRSAIMAASVAEMRSAGLTDTYAAEAAADALKNHSLDVMALHLANEVRRAMNRPTRSVFDGDGISEESLAEYFRRMADVAPGQEA